MDNSAPLVGYGVSLFFAGYFFSGMITHAIKAYRSWRAYGTGRALTDGDLAFIGTVMSHGGTVVFHVFEVKL